MCDLCCVAVVSASGSRNFLFGGDLLEFCGVWDVFLGVVMRVAIAGGKDDVVRMRCEKCLSSFSWSLRFLLGRDVMPVPTARSVT